MANRVGILVEVFCIGDATLVGEIRRERDGYGLSNILEEGVITVGSREVSRQRIKGDVRTVSRRVKRVHVGPTDNELVITCRRCGDVSVSEADLYRWATVAEKSGRVRKVKAHRV